jgi:hypothetical protein
MRKLGILLVLACLVFQVQAQEGLSKKFGFGGQVGHHHMDFGIGLNVTSPYFAHKKTAVRVKANLVYNEHLGGNSLMTWTKYSNVSAGLVQSVGEINNFLRVYGEAGAIWLFPSHKFSSKAIQFGGYGLFGFEFFFDKHFNYFLEAGGVGTGAKADKIEGSPIYSNGFLMNVGVRVQF